MIILTPRCASITKAMRSPRWPLVDCPRPATRYSSGQAHLFQNGGVARVALQALQQRVAFQCSEPAITLDVGPLQPLERPVGLSAKGIHLGNLESVDRLVFRDKLCKGRVCFLLPPQGLICERQPGQLHMGRGKPPGEHHAIWWLDSQPDV